MSRLAMLGLFALSYVIAGCQNVKPGQVTPQSRSAAVNPVSHPTTPVQPGLPGNPGNPGNPGLPIDPGTPVTTNPTGPNTPDNPGTPANPTPPTGSVPVVPSTPTTPGTPTPSNPTNPTNPGTPITYTPITTVPKTPQYPKTPVTITTTPPTTSTPPTDTPPATTKPPVQNPPTTTTPPTTSTPVTTTPPTKSNPPSTTSTPPPSTSVPVTPVTTGPTTPVTTTPANPGAPLNPAAPNQPNLPNMPISSYPTGWYPQGPNNAGPGGLNPAIPGGANLPAFASPAMQKQLNAMGAPWTALNALPTGPIVGGPGEPTQQVQMPLPQPFEDCRQTGNCPVINPGAAPATIGQNIPGSMAPSFTPDSDLSCKPVAMAGTVTNKKLDILFVWDTSDSMRGGQENGTGGELGMLMPSMDSFTAQLDPSTDVRIGMILGHAPASASCKAGMDAKQRARLGCDNVHGKLFQVDANDPAVLTPADLKSGRVATVLKNKLSHLPKDHTEAQGEALFSSLYDAVANRDSQLEIKRQGLLRKDATLLVITVSDEQEVCFDYKAAGSKRPPVRIGNHWELDKHELNTFNGLCATAAGGKRMSADRMYDALVLAKGGDKNKVKVLGVHYTKSGVPKSVQDHWSEMEEGHGYEELIKRAHGTVADMKNIERVGKVDYIGISKLFSYLGKYTEESMEFQNSYECDSSVHPESINATNVQVQFFDTTRNKTVAVFSTACAAGNSCRGTDFSGAAETDLQFDGQAQRSGMEVSINPDVLATVLKKAGFKQGEARIYFSTRSDVDKKTGQKKSVSRKHVKQTR